MKSKTLILSLLFAGALSLGAINCWAADVDVFPLHIIGVPGWSNYTTANGGPLAASADIGWVDANRFYIADRGASTTTGTERVTIIDALTDEFLLSVTGFVGAGGNKGPNGVTVVNAPGAKELWAGDGDSSVKVVDLKADPPTIIATIPIPNSTGRADELAYDSRDRIIVVGSDKDTPKLLTFISQQSRTVLGQIVYNGTAGTAHVGNAGATGMEQPAYDKTTGKFYVSVPGTTANPGGEIDVINPKTETVEKVITFTVQCTPNGLAVGFHHRLLVGCNYVATGTAGVTILIGEDGLSETDITNVGANDEVWYNPGDFRYYTASKNPTSGGGLLGVIDAKTETWLFNVPTGPVVPTPTPATSTHSLAVNSTNNHVFVPVGLPGAIGGYSYGILALEHEGKKD